VWFSRFAGQAIRPLKINYIRVKNLSALNLLLSLSLNNVFVHGTDSQLLTGAPRIEKPKFIIILADDLGYGDLGCYGNVQNKTPNIDQLAKEGIRFLDFHSNGAVSSPTRAALLTGKYQQRTGITGVITAKEHRGKGLALSENTLAEALKKEGYKTAIFGKWHLGYAKEYNPVNQGFDEFIGYVSGNIDYQSHVDQEGYYDWWSGDELTNQRGYTTDLIAENAIDFIKRTKESPFFLFIPHAAPHYPYQKRSSRADRSPGGILGKDFTALGSEKNIPAVYKEMIELLDQAIGMTLNFLKESNQVENTIVIFCSDNGANNHGSNGILKGYKGSVWEGGHRVPAIIRWPEYIKPGRISTETVLTMDLFPTILELAGCISHDDYDGRSIARHLLDNESLPPRTLFWQHIGNSSDFQFSVRKGKWKLVASQNNEVRELYDLNSDVKELLNVSDLYPDTVNDMLDELEEWRKSF